MSVVFVSGRLLCKPDANTDVRYAAASPADHNGSFSGSGMPFTSEAQAFDTTPNRGTLIIGVDGDYSVELLLPNSYYRRLGSDLVPPTLYVAYHCGGQSLTLSTVIGPPIPFRTLTYPSARHDVMFYDRGSHDMLRPDRDARTQEHMIRESAYPQQQPLDFWGPVVPQ